MKRSGTADLPLHYGTVPEWLHSRMTLLGREIVRALVIEYGTNEVLRRLSDPFWFQALGSVMGMDWHSAGIRSFVDDPHTAIVGENVGEIMNLCDSRAHANRQGIVEFLSQHPDVQLREMRHLVMDREHEIKARHVDSKRLGAVLALAYEKQFKEFVDALLLPGVGPRTVQSLALVSEVIYGSPSRFSDPARFAFAHGGKDGHPFPVPLKVYDESIVMLRNAVNAAKIDNSDKLRGIKVLGKMSRAIEENLDPFADVDKVIKYERQMSHFYGGMTVKGPAKPPRYLRQNEGEQLSLFDGE